VADCSKCCNASFNNSSDATAGRMQDSISEFIAKQSEPLGSLDGNENFVRVSED